MRKREFLRFGNGGWGMWGLYRGRLERMHLELVVLLEKYMFYCGRNRLEIS